MFSDSTSTSSMDCVFLKCRVHVLTSRVHAPMSNIICLSLFQHTPGMLKYIGIRFIIPIWHYYRLIPHRVKVYRLIPPRVKVYRLIPHRVKVYRLIPHGVKVYRLFSHRVKVYPLIPHRVKVYRLIPHIVF